MVGVRKGVLPRSSMTIQNSEVKTQVLLECLEEGRMGREAQARFCTSQGQRRSVTFWEVSLSTSQCHCTSGLL